MRAFLWQIAFAYTYELRPYLDLLLYMLRQVANSTDFDCSGGDTGFRSTETTWAAPRKSSTSDFDRLSSGTARSPTTRETW